MIIYHLHHDLLHNHRRFEQQHCHKASLDADSHLQGGRLHHSDYLQQFDLERGCCCCQELTCGLNVQMPMMRYCDYDGDDDDDDDAEHVIMLRKLRVGEGSGSVMLVWVIMQQGKDQVEEEEADMQWK